MLMKDTTDDSVQWSMRINFQGADNWFNLLLSLYKIKGQYVYIHIKRMGVAPYIWPVKISLINFSALINSKLI